MEPLISVVICAYNMEKYIGNAIESLKNQTYKNMEIVVVDDGSIDNTLSICNDYSTKDSRIVVIHQENKGLSFARMKGALSCSGEYVGFIDADDTIEKDMYEFLLKNALKYDADISHCGYTMIMPTGEKKNYYGTGDLIVQDHERGLIDLLEGRYIEPTTCTKLYKRSLFDEIEFFTDISICEDLMLNYLLFSKSKKSIYQDECKYYYCRRNDSMSRTISIVQFNEPIIVKKRIFDISQNESERIQEIAKTKLVSQYISNCFFIKEHRYAEYKAVFDDNQMQLKKVYKTVSLSSNDKIKAWIILYAPWLCSFSRSLYNRIKLKK